MPFRLNMKKGLFLILSLFLVACSTNEAVTIHPQQEIPIIKANETYPVLVEENIVYAQGLSHASINSTNPTTMPLLLDVYTPDNGLENRPVFMFMHGGGFIIGSKKNIYITNLANYYTSRGWVFVSINYRLQNNYGTVPQEWEDFSINLPSDGISQFLAIYPAQRDAKAALRWLVANANTYKINTNYITVGGSSAGAVTAIQLGISKQEEYRDEISAVLDPTLSTTNLEQTYTVRTIIDLWGSKIAVDILEQLYNSTHFNSKNPPLLIVHGTEDTTVLFSEAEALKTIYETTGVPLAYYPLEGMEHAAWNALINNKPIEAISFDFIVDQQNLIVE